MKKMSLAIFIVLASLNLSGCAMVFSDKQYDAGVYAPFPATLKQIENKKLAEVALMKLKETAVKVDPIKGYQGTLYNNNSKKTVEFRLRGTENKSLWVSAKVETEEYLLPGWYTCTVYDENGRVVRKAWAFHVSPSQDKVDGKPVHFHLTAKR